MNKDIKTEETVKIKISILIEVNDEVCDTDIPVSVWNAMTDDERSRFRAGLWNDFAQCDSGGISVVTEGAEGV